MPDVSIELEWSKRVTTHNLTVVVNGKSVEVKKIEDMEDVEIEIGNVTSFFDRNDMLTEEETSAVKEAVDEWME